jgi:nucleoside-diphosphate-sugar epimerase
MNAPKVLVTGAAGSLGNWAVEHLRDAGQEGPRVLSRSVRPGAVRGTLCLVRG